MPGSGHTDRLREAQRAAQAAFAGRAAEAVTRFSGGMKRRLNLSLGLVHRPRVVMMDEPTVGIDPQAREVFSDVPGDATAAHVDPAGIGISLAQCPRRKAGGKPD